MNNDEDYHDASDNDLKFSSITSDDQVLLTLQKPKKRDRRILHQWDRNKEVTHLIRAVRSRPMLWDDSCPEYKVSHSKTTWWADVAKELNIKGVDGNGAKCKWNSIRNNFKACLIKYRSRKSGCYENSAPTTWLHFSEMMFLENGVVNDETTPPSESNSWVNVICFYLSKSNNSKSTFFFAVFLAGQ